MKRNNLQERIQSLKEVQASDSLRKRLISELSSLSPITVEHTFTLPAFRIAIAGILFLIVLGCGSGVVAAAKGSHPGSILYPLKKVIVQTQITFTADTVKKEALRKEVEEKTPAIAPSASPSAVPTTMPSVRVKEREDTEKESGKEVEGASTSAVPLHVIISPKEKEDGIENNHSVPLHISLPPRRSDDDSLESDN